MAYREKVRKHAERVDSALRLVGKYKQSSRYAAHLDASVEVTSAYVPTKLKAHLRCHKNGLMLLQLDTLCLPDGCSRFRYTVSGYARCAAVCLPITTWAVALKTFCQL